MSGGAVLRPLPKASKREHAVDKFLDMIDGVIGEKTESGYQEMYKPAKEESKLPKEKRMAGPEEVPEEPKFEEESKLEEKVESPKEEEEEDILGQYLKKYKK